MSSSSGSKGKKFTLKNVFDGFRGTGSFQNRQDTEIEETLRSEHYHASKTVRHGFPFQPTALAFDSVQHLLAIGNRTGSLRIIGQPGVDCFCSHNVDVSIIQILFLINEGSLVTVTSDDHLHLWNFRHKQPRIVHSLKFQREKISKCHHPFQSKWLYVGTEKGNVHVVNIESFTCSGYIINWNKAIELSRKTHPGPVVHLSDNPVDSSKLLIGFESGAIVFWDLKTKSAESRYNTQEALRSVSWHNEGKQFMCSHSDGSLSTWNVRTPHRPISVISPHAKMGTDGKLDVCKPIAKVEWRSAKTGEAIIIFSGGMSYDRAGRTPSLTVIAGKSTTVLEMEHNVVDFVSLCDTPWANDFQDPYAIVVLLQNDLVVIDLSSPGYPCFENPYPMDLHESPVTACQYYVNCPMDIIPALYSTGKSQKKTGFSEKPWPIKGGSWGARGTSYPEIIITGHADGSLKFWDASSVTLQFLYKLKTAKVFEKPKKPSEDKDDDPFAIQNIFLCLESRLLCVAGPTHCILFRFSKQETSVETVSLEFPIVYEVYDELDSPEFEYSKTSLSVVGQNSSSMGSYSSSASDNAKVPTPQASFVQSETVTSLKVRAGSHRWGPGFLPDLVCLLCWTGGEPQGNITVMSLNSSYGLLAFGNESGLAIVDYMQKACLLNLGTPDLYGSMDPYQRAPKSPRSKRAPLEGLTLLGSDDCKSPTVDQSGFYLTHGSDKSGESSPNSPLTPNGIPGCQASVQTNMGGSMAPALSTTQSTFRTKFLAPTQVKVLPDAQQQELKDHQQVHTQVDLVLPGLSDITLPLPYFHLTAPANSVHLQSPCQKPKGACSSNSRKSPEPQNLFDNDYLKASNKHETIGQQNLTGISKSPPQNKHKCYQQRALVHQPALDLPLSPNNETITSPAQDSDSTFFSFSQPQWNKNSSPLTPVILLPRSVSEMSQISGKNNLFYKSELLENPALLSPSSPLKSLCISIGDIPTGQCRHANSSSSSPEKRKKGTDGKTLSRPERITLGSDRGKELGDILRKSSSDSQISLSDKVSSLELVRQTSDTQRKNWLMSKICRISKKKKKGGEEVEAGELNMCIQTETGEMVKKLDGSTLVNSNCDIVETDVGMGSEIVSAENRCVGDEEEYTNFGLGEVRSAENNKKFLSRVSLKIKSFGSRKCSNEDEDMGAASGQKCLLRCQERQPKVKIEVLDLTDDTARKHSMRKVYLSDVMQSRKSVDKTDGSSFSRSRSSSISSLDNVGKEAIQCLVFADSYTRKLDNETSPCLWVGTSLGSIIVIVLIMQPEQRLSQPVIVSPSGSLYRMKGAIVCMSFLDFKGGLLHGVSEQWKDNRDNKDVNEKMSLKATSRQMSMSSSRSKISPPSSTEINYDRQFVIVCSEKQARAITLPSQTCAFKVKVTETSFVVRAEIVSLRESVCLMCYVANGHLMAFSLPSLKPLFDADFLPSIDIRVARTFCFSNNGHAMFLCSPTEIQKITYSAEISENLNEMLGDLFLPKDTPEAPKQSFLKSLFGGGVATLDREELFGEASGKASKSLAKHIPGTGNIQHLQQHASASANEFSRTRLLVTERGEKLGEVEDRSLLMMNAAEQIGSAAHGVLLKYKDKKWYQF